MIQTTEEQLQEIVDKILIDTKDSHDLAVMLRDAKNPGREIFNHANGIFEVLIGVGIIKKEIGDIDGLSAICTIATGISIGYKAGLIK